MLLRRMRFPVAPGPKTTTPGWNVVRPLNAITLPAPGVSPPISALGVLSMLTPYPLFPSGAAPVASVPTKLPCTMFPVASLVCVPAGPPPHVVGSPQIAIPAKPVFPETTFPITKFPGAFRM
jgi:hypothetical protein